LFKVSLETGREQEGEQDQEKEAFISHVSGDEVFDLFF
jgi:hypothetical protein